jgi:hypothetical protein
MGRRSGIVALALALLLALAPAALALDGPGPPLLAEPGDGHTAIKYLACAGSIALAVLTVSGVYFAALICAEAMLD